MSEFSLGQGKVSKGALAAAGAAVKYLVVPLVLIYLVTTFAGDMGADLSMFHLQEIQFTVLIFGILITVFSFFRGFYPKGSRSRFLFGAISVAFVVLWIWFALLGGKLSLDLGQAGGSIDFSGLVYLFIFAAALKALYFLVEMISYRKEYLSGVQFVTKSDGSQPIVP